MHACTIERKATPIPFKAAKPVKVATVIITDTNGTNTVRRMLGIRISMDLVTMITAVTAMVPLPQMVFIDMVPCPV